MCEAYVQMEMQMADKIMETLLVLDGFTNIWLIFFELWESNNHICPLIFHLKIFKLSGRIKY